MQKWNKEKVIKAIKKRYKNDKYLDHIGLSNDDPSLLSACQYHFKSREEAIKASGIDPLKIKKHPINRMKSTAKPIKNRLHRILMIIYYINNELGTTTRFLAEKLDVSERTIQRDIQVLRQIPDIEVIYIDHKSGYDIRFTDEKEHIYNDRYMYIWTTKDLKILEFLVSQNVSTKKIAQLLGRTEQSINIKKSQIQN